MEEEAVRWSVKVSKDTDLTLRTFLGAHGMKKGALSRFIEDAVRWRLFDQTVTAIKARNTDTDPETLMEMIDSTVRDVRRERAKKRRAAGAKP